MWVPAESTILRTQSLLMYQQRFTLFKSRSSRTPSVNTICGRLSNENWNWNHENNIFWLLSGRPPMCTQRKEKKPSSQNIGTDITVLTIRVNAVNPCSTRTQEDSCIRMTSIRQVNSDGLSFSRNRCTLLLPRSLKTCQRGAHFSAPGQHPNRKPQKKKRQIVAQTSIKCNRAAAGRERRLRIVCS